MPSAVPVWAWPPAPLKLLKWVFAYPGFLLPWNVVFFGIAVATWAYLTPELARMANFHVNWIAEIYFRAPLEMPFSARCRFRIGLTIC